jgi:hypothetical protein
MFHLSLFPEIHSFIMVCLPWFWVTIRGSQDGGFSVEIEKPPKDTLPNHFSFPDQIAYIEFYPHGIRGQYWQIPNTHLKWKWEIIWAYDELVEWLQEKLRTHS